MSFLLSNIPVFVSLLPPFPPLWHHGHAQICALTAASVSVSLDNVPQGLQGEQWRESRGQVGAEWTSHESQLSVLNGGTMGEWVWRSSMGPVRVGVPTHQLFCCRRSRRMAHWPLNVPAQVRHLHVAPDHEGAGQVEAVLRVSLDELVVFTEGVAEHLIQSGKHSSRRQSVHTMFLYKHFTIPDYIYILTNNTALAHHL